MQAARGKGKAVDKGKGIKGEEAVPAPASRLALSCAPSCLGLLVECRLGTGVFATRMALQEVHSCGRWRLPGIDGHLCWMWRAD